MKSVIINVLDSSKKISTHLLNISNNKPTIIKAEKGVNYEFVDSDFGVAPNHIITKRDGDNLSIFFSDAINVKAKQVGILIIEDFYLYPQSALVGLAENKDYYYYIPDTGELSDYVTQLDANNDKSGQALGGTSFDKPWWTGEALSDGSSTSLISWLLPVGVASLGAYVIDKDKDEAVQAVSEESNPADPQVNDDDNSSETSESDNTNTINGNDLSDTLTGSDNADTIQGLGGDDILIGKAGDDILIGGDGIDTLSGGEGSDTLTGGDGNDTFQFNTPLDDSIDTITDFIVGEDKIELSKSVFTAITSDDNVLDHIQYDDKTGQLSYSDGDSAEAVHFATLSTGLTLTEDSFQVI